MSSITGIGTTFNLPNYHGELIQLSPTETPLLSASGGISGGGSVTDTIIEWQGSDLRRPSARPRLEGADAPTMEERVRQNFTNRVQIFQEAVGTSYTKQAAIGRYADLAQGAPNPVTSEHSWQVMQALTQVARDLNFSMWNAVRNDPSDNTTARQMAGLLSVMTSNVPVKQAITTGASASTDTITVTHNLAVGDKVVFTDVGASTTIVAGVAYWVTSVSTTASFKVSATSGGAAITVGTATVSFYSLKQANIITKDDVDALLQSVFDNNGITDQGTATIFAPSGIKRALTKAYATASNAISQYNGTRNVGGLNLETIYTDFGLLNIVVERMLPADALAVVSVEQIQPVYLAIPEKGVLFEEELAKTGASTKTQIYGEIGFAYGNQASHGVLRGIFTP